MRMRVSLALLCLFLCFSAAFADKSSDRGKKPASEVKMSIYLDGNQMKNIEALQIDRMVYIPIRELCGQLKFTCEEAGGAVVIQGKKPPCPVMEKDGVLYAEYQALKPIFPYKISLNRNSNVVALWSGKHITSYRVEPDTSSPSRTGSSGGNAQGGASSAPLAVTKSTIRSDSTYAERIIMDAYVENLTDKFARHVTVYLVINDPSGLSAFDGTTNPREYGRYTASIQELKPHGAQWVTITTGLARPIAVNEGARTITMELVGPSKDFSSTKVNLQYYFEVMPGSISDQ